MPLDEEYYRLLRHSMEMSLENQRTLIDLYERVQRIYTILGSRIEYLEARISLLEGRRVQ